MKSKITSNPPVRSTEADWVTNICLLIVKKKGVIFTSMAVYDKMNVTVQGKFNLEYYITFFMDKKI